MTTINILKDFFRREDYFEGILDTPISGSNIPAFLLGFLTECISKQSKKYTTTESEY
jgi:hypothetical protein